MTARDAKFVVMREFATKFHRRVDEQGQKYQGLSTGAQEVSSVFMP
jgi:hypothetical protein